MYQFIFAIILILGISDCLQAQLSLEECQCLALENSEKISIADLHLLIERDRTAEAWGMAYPRLTAEGQYIAAGEPRNFIKKHKTANAKASLIVPLFNFGGASNLITAQEKRYHSSFYTNERVRQEVIYAVTQAYYGLLEFQKIEQVVKESLTTLQEQLRISEDFYKQGLVHRNDVLLIELQFAQREQDFIQAEHNRALQEQRLNRLMGIDLDTKLEIEDIYEIVECQDDLESFLAAAEECRPDLGALQLQVCAAYYAYKGEKGELYPKVYAFSDYSTTNDYNFPYTHGINAGIGMEVNLYDGGTTHARIRRMRKEWLELHQVYCALIEDISLEVRSAYLQLQNAAHKIPVALKSIHLAEESLKITQNQYQEGIVTMYDLLNDEERLAEARSNYYQALYEFHRAQGELMFATGTNLGDSL
jgi:outer membrane protein TolC